MGSPLRQARSWHHLPYALSLLGLLVILITGANLWLQQRREPSVTGASFQLSDSREEPATRLGSPLLAQPANSSDDVQLGTSYLQKARETGDPSYYYRAEEVLSQTLDGDANPAWLKARAMTVMGAVALGRHEFHQALEWAQRSIEIDPAYASSYGVLGDAQMELGQYDDAVKSFQAMLDLKPDLGSYARAARLRELRGDIPGAIAAMKMAVAAGSARTEPIAWARVQLGNLYFNSGSIDEAVEQYQAALTEFDGYYLALASLGKARAAQGDYSEAIDLLEQAAAIVPQPATLATLGDLYARTGQLEKAQLQYDTVEFIARLAAVNQQIYNRELALFYADHDLKLDSALELSEKELKVRQDIYGYDALAWTLFKNNRPNEAADAINQAMRLGTQDASIFFHAGVIYYGLGDWTQAGFYLEKALELNPHFSILYSDRARDLLQEINGKLATPQNARVEVAP
ncbi:MAG TPA: tetratricopeptide repeat protein [Dehalococcoidia bacterium]|nr:tetratricopeptide repeat protein [Dehalococcoidia bacterium]